MNKYGIMKVKSALMAHQEKTKFDLFILLKKLAF